MCQNVKFDGSPTNLKIVKKVNGQPLFLFLPWCLAKNNLSKNLQGLFNRKFMQKEHTGWIERVSTFQFTVLIIKNVTTKLEKKTCIN